MNPKIPEMKMQDQPPEKVSALDAILYDGGTLDPILSIGTWALVIAGAFFLLKKKKDPRSYCLLLASLALISYTFREYQVSLSLSLAKDYPGIDPYDLLVDLWFICRGSTLRFAAITLGLIIATAFQVFRKKD